MFGRKRKRRTLVPVQQNKLQSNLRSNRAATYSGIKTAKTRKLNITLKKLALTLLAFFVALSLFAYAYKAKFWQIQEVEFNAEYQNLPGVKPDLTNKLLGKNLLLLNPNEYIQQLHENPYVAEAYLEKKFPGTVYVHILEHKPVLYFYDLNTLYLYSDEGRLLSQVSLENKYEVEEEERLIYSQGKPFKSVLVKDKWLAANLEKLQADFDAYQLANPVAEGQISTSGTETPDGGASPDGSQPPQDGEVPVDGTPSAGGEEAEGEAPDTRTEFQKYVDEKFSELEIRELERYYYQIRQDILKNVIGRWEEHEKVARDDGEILKLYSLIEPEKVYNLDELMRTQYFTQVQRGLTQRFVVEKFIIVSPVTMKVHVQDAAQQGEEVKNKEIFFNLGESVATQMLELEVVLQDLEQDSVDYTTIDVSGKKVVVS